MTHTFAELTEEVERLQYIVDELTPSTDKISELRSKAGLTQSEAVTVAVLMRRPGVTFSASQLVSAAAWPRLSDAAPKVVAVRVCRARKALKAAGIPFEIINVHGVGYYGRPKGDAA